MIKTFCDRCGKEISESESSHPTVSYSYKTNPYVDSKQKGDLCLYCKRDIIRVIEKIEE